MIMGFCTSSKESGQAEKYLQGIGNKKPYLRS